MMKLSTMALGDRRLAMNGDLPVAAQGITCWSHDPDSARLFRYSSNFVFAFSHEGQRRFLRAAHERERSAAQIEAEVSLITWLAAEGVAVAAPLPSSDGRLVEHIDTEVGVFHTVVFPGLDGEQFETDDLDLDGLVRWGRALGQLHAAMRRYPGKADAARPSWRDDLALARASVRAPERAIEREINELEARLGMLPVSPETYGLIHFDFELDNLLWNGPSSGILDFDDCAHHWFAADIAFALRDLFDAGAGLEDPRAQAFLRGYRESEALDDAMMAAVPLFSRLSRLTGFARLTRALDLDPAPQYPDWLRDLEGRLQAMRFDDAAAITS